MAIVGRDPIETTEMEVPVQNATRAREGDHRTGRTLAQDVVILWKMSVLATRTVAPRVIARLPLVIAIDPMMKTTTVMDGQPSAEARERVFEIAMAV